MINNKNTEFPQFRQLKNGRRLYKIKDDRNFSEIQIMGEKALFFEMHATKYPEILLIQDILNNKDIYLPISEEFFNRFVEEKV